MVSDVDSANKFGDGVGDLDAVVGVEEKVEGEVVFDSVDWKKMKDRKRFLSRLVHTTTSIFLFRIQIRVRERVVDVVVIVREVAVQGFNPSKVGDSIWVKGGWESYDMDEVEEGTTWRRPWSAMLARSRKEHRGEKSCNIAK